MREATQGRRVEAVARPGAAEVKPQWQNLFQAPVYQGDFADHMEVEVEVRMESEQAGGAPRRRGRRRPS